MFMSFLVEGAAEGDVKAGRHLQEAALGPREIWKKNQTVGRILLLFKMKANSDNKAGLNMFERTCTSESMQIHYLVRIPLFNIFLKVLSHWQKLNISLAQLLQKDVFMHTVRFYTDKSKFELDEKQA